MVSAFVPLCAGIQGSFSDYSKYNSFRFRSKSLVRTDVAGQRLLDGFREVGLFLDMVQPSGVRTHCQDF